jgi:hypothetical protein
VSIQLPSVLSAVLTPSNTFQRHWYSWADEVTKGVNSGGGGGGVPTSRTISTTAPLAGGGDLSADRTLTISTFSSIASGIVPASGGGTVNFLRADGTWSAPASGGGGYPEQLGYSR